jgi:hypothetical protein
MQKEKSNTPAEDEPKVTITTKHVTAYYVEIDGKPYSGPHYTQEEAQTARKKCYMQYKWGIG